MEVDLELEVGALADFALLHAAGRGGRESPVGHVPREHVADAEAVLTFDASGAAAHRLVEYDAAVEHGGVVGDPGHIFDLRGGVLFIGAHDGAALGASDAGEHLHPVDRLGAGAAVDEDGCEAVGLRAVCRHEHGHDGRGLLGSDLETVPVNGEPEFGLLCT